MSDNPPAPGATLAQQYFYTVMTKERFEHELANRLYAACGLDFQEPPPWPIADVVYDPYDYSFEFKGCTPGWVPTAEQLHACFALGFARCWICYSDGGERYADERTPPTPVRERHKKAPITRRLRRAYHALMGRP